MTRDEDGAIQVVEAILVAVLVGSALIFFALSQRPTVPPSGPATDLSQVATDTLMVLQGSAPGDADTDVLAGYARADPGDPDLSDVKSSITGLLPDGMQFALQFSVASGAPTITAVCSGDCDAGAGAQAGVAYVVDGGVLHRAELVVWDVF